MPRAAPRANREMGLLDVLWADRYLRWREVQDYSQDQLVKQTKPKPPPGPSAIYDPLKMNLGQVLDLPTMGKNLFVDLTERTALSALLSARFAEEHSRAKIGLGKELA